MPDLNTRVRELIRQELRLLSPGMEPEPMPELLPSSFVDKIYLCTAVEEAFDLAFRTEQFIKCHTVADVCALVGRQVGRAA